MGRPAVVAFALAAVVVLAGCGGLLPGDEPTAAETTVTPAPVPSDDRTTLAPEETATPLDSGPNGHALAGSSTGRDDWVGISAGSNRSSITQPRYLGLRPTCERPPGQVVHVQVGALANNDPTTDAGIETAWRFMAPSYRESVDESTFVDRVSSDYRPLLRADAVAHRSLDLDGDTATRRVSVRTADGVTSYRWELRRHDEAPYDGCWLTTGLSRVEDA